MWTQFVSTDFASALNLDALNNRYLFPLDNINNIAGSICAHCC